MSGFNGMLVMMAHVAPEEILIEQLEDGIKEWKEAKLLGASEAELEKKFKALTFPIALVMTKIQAGDDPLKMIERIDKLEKTDEMLSQDNHS